MFPCFIGAMATLAVKAPLRVNISSAQKYAMEKCDACIFAQLQK